MIHTAKQLKDKVKNMSGGNSEVAQAIIRTYFVERFLERVSVSEYRNNFILKGGMLVASIVGVDMRATMDIDTTVKALPLNEKDARAIIERIGELQLEDGVNFKITSVKEIMEEFDYPGIRMMIEARNADCIMVLENGKIIECGNHEQLIEEKGRYYQLYTGDFELSY